MKSRNLCSLQAENFRICAVCRQEISEFVQFVGKKVPNLCSFAVQILIFAIVEDNSAGASNKCRAVI